MSILGIAFFAAIGYYIIVYKAIGRRKLIKTQTFHIRFLSEEYKDRDFTGKQYCIDNGIELFFHLRKHQYSSTELRNRVYEFEKIKRKEIVEERIEQYSPKLLNKYINDEGKGN